LGATEPPGRWRAVTEAATADRHVRDDDHGLDGDVDVDDDAVLLILLLVMP
jgi:hypothetical protein